MGYDGWMQFGSTELINLSRTAQLAEVLGIDMVWTEPSTVAWVQDALAGTDYDLINEAPWYDANHPASTEFAGIVSLGFSGLDDSTREATVVEYITDGGASGKARNATLSIVASVAIVASTERGADFGKRWLDRVLSDKGARTFCAGSDLTYFPYAQDEGQPVPPLVHRRDVTLGRGVSITRKRGNNCSTVWLATFTLTANDPFEYGEERPQFSGLGGAVTGPGVDVSGSLPAMVEQSCPVYAYDPIYDPLHPALVPPPTVPHFYPDGWDLLPGVGFNRSWVRLDPVTPTILPVVPVLTLTTDAVARMVRVSIWPGDMPTDSFCEPLWSAIVAYLPPTLDFVIDGEQQACYAWDGFSPAVRRTDSVVYGPEAHPIQWRSFNDPAGLLVALDVMTGAGYDGGGTVRAALSLVPKSD